MLDIVSARSLKEPVAQLVERLTFNEDVHGSSPCGLTILVEFFKLHYCDRVEVLL